MEEIYFSIGFAVFVIIPLGTAIRQVSFGRVDLKDLIMTTVLGVVGGLVWPLTLFVLAIYGLAKLADFLLYR